MDGWSGYDANRDRLMRFLAELKPRNLIVITGDIHSNWVIDLKVNWKDNGDGSDELPATAAQYRENPRLKMYNGRRGYIMMTVDWARCEADYRIVPYVTRPGAPSSTQSRWVAENDRRGVLKA